MVVSIKEMEHTPKPYRHAERYPEWLANGQTNVLGIVGGLGPGAHEYFIKLVREERARRGDLKSDQDNPYYVLESGSFVPDRTEAILESDPKQREQKRDTVTRALKFLTKDKLQDSDGVDAVVVICNTAHWFLKAVQKGLRIPWIHMLRETAKDIRSQLPEGSKVGVMATKGTQTTKLYQQELETVGLVPVSPDPESERQQKVTDGIYSEKFGIKVVGPNDQATRNFLAEAIELKKQDVQAIILGCTEIPLGLNPEILAKLSNSHDLPILIDPMQVIAKILLDISFGKRDPKEFMVNYTLK